jgi:hypothetical protein
MMTAPTLTPTRTSDSSDRTPALAAARPGTPARQPKIATRFGSAARRLLNALMRSLAAPHV